MPINSDSHMHTSYSQDSDAPMEEMIQESIRKGLKHICITEHMDIDYPVRRERPDENWICNVDAYLYDILKFRDQYKDQLDIGFGIELGLQTDICPQNARVAKEHEFDFIIGSLHVVDKMDPYFPEYFGSRSSIQGFEDYFQCTYANIRRFSNFDVLGHLDYVIRYAPDKAEQYSYKNHSDIIDSILEYLIENGKGLEVNSGGLRRGLTEPHPCTDILKRYRELGGEIITVGSDAHKPSDIAAGYNIVQSVLKDVGFSYHCIYRNRIAEYIKL